MITSLSATDIAGLAAGLLLGLSAGLFFIFSIAIMPALRHVSDSAFADTMNSINRVILNPLFMLAFLGSLVAAVVATVLAFAGGESARGWLFAVATAIYFVGVVGVTGGVNVPLNNALAANSDRGAFEHRWVRFNNLRTIAAILALALVLVGLVL